jgi:hypothetical protein
MHTYEEVKQAILDLLRELKLEPEKALSLYEIGIPLVPKGYSQDELVNALLSMDREGVIKLLPNNGMRLLQPLY